MPVFSAFDEEAELGTKHLQRTIRHVPAVQNTSPPSLPSLIGRLPRAFFEVFNRRLGQILLVEMRPYDEVGGNVVRLRRW